MVGGPASRPELVGRPDELARIQDAFAALDLGSGRALLVEGEAGIGKSRLLEELVDRGRARGVQVAVGACEEFGEASTFRPLTRALGISRSSPDSRLTAVARRLDQGAATDLVPPETSSRFAVQEAIIDLVERLADRGPLVLTVDDLQWADEATVAALAALCRRTHDLPVLVVAAFRPSTAVDRLLDAAAEIGADHLRLGPLDDATVARLVNDVAGAPSGPGLARMVDGANGNPFFVIELVTALRDEDAIDISDGIAETRLDRAPPTLRQTVLRRVRSLAPPALGLMRAGAILGGEFGIDEVAEMLDQAPVSLHEPTLAAMDAGLLEESGPRLRIRHDIIRESVYADLPEPIRASLHDRAAEVLVARREPVGRVAGHLARGSSGDADAIHMLRRAATDLQGRDPEASAELLERALELVGDPGERTAIEAQRVSVLVALGRLTEAESTARDALGCHPDPDIEARLRIGLARTLLAAGEARGAVGELERAQASPVLHDDDRALLLADIAWARLDLFDLDSAERDALVAESWGREHRNPEVLASALATRSRLAAYSARFDRAVELGRDAVAAAEDDPATVRRTPHLFLGLALANADRGDEALSVLGEGRRRAEAAGIAWAVAAYHSAVILHGFHCGAWDDAIAEGQAGRALHVEAATRAAYLQVESMLGLIWLHRGAYDRAGDALARAETDFSTPGYDVGGIVWLLWLRAGFAELDGELDRAVGLLGAAFDLAEQLRVHSVKLWYGPDLVRLCVAADRTEHAGWVARSVSDAARRASTETARGASLLCTGLVAADPDRLLAAAAAYRATPRRFDQARAGEAAGMLLARVGRTEEAAQALVDARDGYDALGAAHHERRVAATLRDMGVRRGARGPRRRSSTGIASLTPTERTVLGLVGDGLRNGEIADRLFVSRRTVETHVGRLYAKLGIHGRVALAQAASSLRPDTPSDNG